MKELLILRHAEAQAPQFASDDRLRPLTERGKQQALSLGEALATSALTPERVFVSAAVRTEETLQLLRTKLVIEPSCIVASDDLYLAGYDQTLEHLASLSDQCMRVMLVGHNPGWSDLATQITQRVFNLAPCEALWVQHSRPDSDRTSWVDAFTDLGAWRLNQQF